jgi:hypothetical protein
MGTLWQDIRYGLRMLRRSPGFTGVVLLVVGSGIGVNTAPFNALDQVCLRPLPVQRPSELVWVLFHTGWLNRSGESTDGIISYPTYEIYRDQSQIPAGLAAFTGGSKTVSLRIDDMTIPVACWGFPSAISPCWASDRPWGGCSLRNRSRIRLSTPSW